MKIRKSLAVLGASATLALGFGGAMAPSAQAHSPSWERAAYRLADPYSGFTRGGTAVVMPGSVSVVRPDSSSLRCRNDYVSERAYTASCSGERWRAYVECSDGRRYVTPSSLRGSTRAVVFCPRGTIAEDGGVYGR